MMPRWLAVLLLPLLLCLAPFARGQQFLDPAVAFKPTATAVDDRTVEIRFEIAKGYYLYRDKFRFAAPPAKFGSPVFPTGKFHDDENFGKVEVYYDAVAIRLPVERDQAGPLPLKIKVTSQGCADAGICYPPQTTTLAVNLPAAGTPATRPAPASAGDETSRLAGSLKKAGFWTNLLLFFAAGLGLALTPCVFPMVPILSGIIVGSGHRVGRGRAVTLSAAYVLGMAVTYAAAGVAAGLTGTLLSSALQNPWVLGSFALVFVALALSMFGFYELQMPTFLQSKLSEEANHLKGGSLPAVAAMGALSALIAGPCVAAPLAGALLYIGQTGDALFGGIALFVLALGMGAPLLLVGVSAGTLLPRAGPWMEAVKKTFGVVLLATAVWFTSAILPPAAQMVAWGLLLVIPAIYLHALDPLPPHAHGWHRFWKGVGVVMLLAGAAMLIGALAGGRDPLQPLSIFQGGRGGKAEAAEAKLAFVRVATVADLDARLREAAAAGRPAMLDFYADWCVSCKEMERFTFADAAVRARLAGFTLLQADVTANSEADAALLKRFDLFGPPGIVFFDATGREVADQRVVGFQDAPTFSLTLKAAAGG